MNQEQMAEDYFQYEQDQVVWAKIKGYPWWPGYIYEIEGTKTEGQIQYTVFFFGDNTQYLSSRLGQSKIKKFIKHYTQFYQKAKQNRKLKLSIMRAEEKLGQNGENISIFQTLRNSIKKIKKGKGYNSISKNSSDYDNNVFETPQLIKHKTHDPPHIVSHFSEEDRNQSNQNPIYQSVNQEQNQRQSEDIISRKQKTKMEKTKRGRRTKKNQQVVCNFERPFQSDSEQQQDQKQFNQKENDGQDNQIKCKIHLNKTRPRTRGRVRGPQVSVSKEKSSSSPNKQEGTIKKIKKLNSKFEKKSRVRYVEKDFQMSSQDKALIQRIQFCLGNREELIEILCKVEITVNNVKQILDLGVTDILREGQITIEVRMILQLLKVILLYKYFPGDAKIKKKYQKILKRKGIKNEIEHKKQQGTVLKRQNLQIRKKTIVKLENILKEMDKHHAKSYATKIESYFRERDDSIGQDYKKFAYSVLRTLKDKQETIQKVMEKLQNYEYKW